MFPNIRILALSRDSKLQLQAQHAGATVALSPASATLGSTIEGLAHPQKTCAAQTPKTVTPKAKLLPKAAVALQNSLNTVLATQTIQFEAGKSILTTTGRTTIDRLLTKLKRYPQARIRIEGYTDSDGSNAQNLSLSRARAAAVRAYLIQHGISASHLTAVGFGENRPVASNTTAAGKTQNRRIELKVTSG